MNRPIIRTSRAPKALLLLNIIAALIYLSWWLAPGHVGNPWLYGLLLGGEFYHVGMALLFWQTIWPGSGGPSFITVKRDLPLSVDIFITVAGEPASVVRQTALAARDMTYPHHTYLLNDGLVAGKPNWQEMEVLAAELGIACLTRQQAGGAKAGNINLALKHTNGDIVVIFDADMVADATFLTTVLPYFDDPAVGFVQTPQYYANQSLNQVTAGAWEQQEFFFGPVMTGKDKYSAAFVCGTNVAIRRRALEEVGGMCEDNIAEDFLTSLFIHQHGWRSQYVTEVLAQGLAPEDLLSYYKQQLRWARGSLEVLFGHNPFLYRGLTRSQQWQYLASALYYLNGLIVLIDMTMPLLFLYLGWQPVTSATTTLALYFIPFIFLSLFTLLLVSDGQLTFRAMSFSQASWALQLQALWSVLRRQAMGFAVTPKQAQNGNFLRLVLPHLAYVALAIGGIGWAIYREGINASVATNIAWATFNMVMFMPFIAAAYPWGKAAKKAESPQLGDSQASGVPAATLGELADTDGLKRSAS